MQDSLEKSQDFETRYLLSSVRHDLERLIEKSQDDKLINALNTIKALEQQTMYVGPY